ncbi:MAG: late competence development ComFB family protein [Clostridiaceae bacterium]|jgi:competence protein ComFB|nr:late competence development ComFB family protein [Clostridiaceae bacterium]
MSRAELKNYMEEIVSNYLDVVLKDINMCKCEKCKLDVAAKALNDLPPKYVVTKKGEVYSKIDNLKLQFEVDVILAITKAAVLVKRNPKHELKA